MCCLLLLACRCSVCLVGVAFSAWMVISCVFAVFWLLVVVCPVVYFFVCFRLCVFVFACFDRVLVWLWVLSFWWLVLLLCFVFDM